MHVNTLTITKILFKAPTLFFVIGLWQLCFLRFIFGFLRFVFWVFCKVTNACICRPTGIITIKSNWRAFTLACAYPYHCVFAQRLRGWEKIGQKELLLWCGKEANRQLVVKAIIHVQRYVCAAHFYCIRVCVCVHKGGGFSLFFYFSIAHSL